MRNPSRPWLGAGPRRRTIALAADAFGYRRLLAFALEHAPGRRAWAIKGTGSFGSDLTMRTGAAQSVEHRATVLAIRAAARRALALEASDLESQIELLVHDVAPRLVAERGVGPITAAQVLRRGTDSRLLGARPSAIG